MSFWQKFTYNRLRTAMSHYPDEYKEQLGLTSPGAIARRAREIVLQDEI